MKKGPGNCPSPRFLVIRPIDPASKAPIRRRNPPPHARGGLNGFLNHQSMPPLDDVAE
jgi:hypothetical protein